MRRIVVLMELSASNLGDRLEVAALKQSLRDLGWIEGRNMHITVTWSGCDANRFQSAVKELVDRYVTFIVARSTPVVTALVKETRTIPIVLPSRAACRELLSRR